MIDTNSIVRAYLTTQTPLTGLVGARIYCPRLPESCPLPAVSFFTRGGTSTPYIPGMPAPSVQFDCWADNPMESRKVYDALYGSLQGIQNISVAVPARVVGTDGNDYDCFVSHTSNERNKPITGALALTTPYWSATGTTGLGSIWATGELYRPAYEILSAIEEVQGQDLVDVEIPNYFRVLTFFSIMIRAE